MFNREKVLEKKLTSMRIAYSVKKLRLNKERNSFKSRRITRAVARLENGFDKIKFESKTLVLRRLISGYKVAKFSEIVSFSMFKSLND